MEQGKIIVVMGGTSTEAEISRQTGNAVLEALRSKGYDADGMEEQRYRCYLWFMRLFINGAVCQSDYSGSERILSLW